MMMGRVPIHRVVRAAGRRCSVRDGIRGCLVRPGSRQIAEAAPVTIKVMDTLAIALKLRSAGLPEEGANAIAEVIGSSFDTSTKDLIALMHQRIEALKTEQRLVIERNEANAATQVGELKSYVEASKVKFIKWGLGMVTAAALATLRFWNVDKPGV